ncbi:Transcriptional regulator, LysR family [Mesorhizobium loti]|nr:Transcriptional regulator, LysR family [Mesorhizobium loti]
MPAPSPITTPFLSAEKGRPARIWSERAHCFPYLHLKAYERRFGASGKHHVGPAELDLIRGRSDRMVG